MNVRNFSLSGQNKIPPSVKHFVIKRYETGTCSRRLSDTPLGVACDQILTLPELRNSVRSWILRGGTKSRDFVESSEQGLQQVLNSDKMSAYGGSNSRINTLGRRVNSRPDLASGYMMGGNGYQTEYSEYRTFSKNSMGGGGGGGGQG